MNEKEHLEEADGSARLSLAEKGRLLSRIRDLDFPPYESLDPHFLSRLLRIMAARLRPTFRDVTMIAEAAGVTVEYLMSDEEPVAMEQTEAGVLRLADLRAVAGKTQAQVGAAMGGTSDRVSRIERDFPNVRVPGLIAYIRALGGEVWISLDGERVALADVVADPARAGAREVKRAASLREFVRNVGSV